MIHHTHTYVQIGCSPSYSTGEEAFGNAVEPLDGFAVRVAHGDMTTGAAIHYKVLRSTSAYSRPGFAVPSAVMPLARWSRLNGCRRRRGRDHRCLTAPRARRSWKLYWKLHCHPGSERQRPLVLGANDENTGSRIHRRARVSASGSRTFRIVLWYCLGTRDKKKG